MALAAGHHHTHRHTDSALLHLHAPPHASEISDAAKVSRTETNNQSYPKDVAHT